MPAGAGFGGAISTINHRDRTLTFNILFDALIRFIIFTFCFIHILALSQFFVLLTPLFKAKARFEWKEMCKNNTSKLKSKYFQTTVGQYNKITSFDLVMAVYTSAVRVVRLGV